jgi:AraC-like DNA-binding protein
MRDVVVADMPDTKTEFHGAKFSIPHQGFLKVVAPRGRWSLCVEETDDVFLYVLLQGRIVFQMQEVGRIEVAAPAILNLLRGRPHRLHGAGPDRAGKGGTVSDWPSFVGRFAAAPGVGKDQAQLLIGRMPAAIAPTLEIGQPFLMIPAGSTDFWAEAMPVIKALRAETERDPPSTYSKSIVRRLVEVLSLQVDRFRHQKRDSADGTPSRNMLSRMDLVLRAIHEAPQRDWSVPDLSAITGMSRAAVFSGFRIAKGMAPMRYVNLVRIERAKDLLHHGDRTLQEIANDLGYQSYTSFYRAFKAQAGMSPANYRALYFDPE